MTGDIFIYGVIGTNEAEREISFENVKNQIAQNKDAKELIVHMISPGGDVWEGYSIFNAFKNSGKKITAHIEGTCASIATLIVGAADKIIMNRTAQFMIHNPKITGLSQAAEAKDLRNVANQLDQIKTLLIDVYERRTNLSKEKLWELYDNETWLTADEAAKMGFIDESVDAIKAVAKFDLTKFNQEMKDQKKVEGLFARFQNMLKGAKFKNEATETLADGTVIVIMTDDGDYTGKQVMYETGDPVPAGEHQLASGRVIVVDANSVISEVKDPQPAANADMEKDKQIEELKAQLAEAQAKLGEAQKQSAAAEAKAVKFENRVTAIEKDFLALKEEAMKTFGNTDEPNTKGSAFKNKQDQYHSDPMGDMALQFYKNRNLINSEE